MAKADAHKWQFRARFRRGAFGWKSEPAIRRIKQAVSEIKKIARKESLRAAEGAVLFLEKVSPAIEHVDGSSGSIGAAVNNAIAALVPIIAEASADTKTRAAWLDRLFEAHREDQIPYIESLADYWGELCATPELAAEWADRLLDVTRTALSPDKVRKITVVSNNDDAQARKHSIIGTRLIASCHLGLRPQRKNSIQNCRRYSQDIVRSQVSNGGFHSLDFTA